MASTVLISDHGHDLLAKLAEETGKAMSDVLDAALENYRREQFLRQANQAFAAVSAAPHMDRSYREELASLEGTLSDGLQNPPK